MNRYRNRVSQNKIKNVKNVQKKRTKKKLYIKSFVILACVSFMSQKGYNFFKKNPTFFSSLGKTFSLKQKKISVEKKPQEKSVSQNNKAANEDLAQSVAVQVSNHKRFSEVTVSRSFTGKEYVYVREAAPVAIWAKSGSHVYIDGLGRELEGVGGHSETLKLPVISGDLIRENQNETHYLLREALVLAKKMSFLFGVSEIHWSAQWGWLVYGMNPRLTVVVGPTLTDLKYNRLVQVMKKMHSNEAMISTVDLDFNDRVVVKFKGEEYIDGQS